MEAGCGGESIAVTIAFSWSTSFWPLLLTGGVVGRVISWDDAEVCLQLPWVTLLEGAGSLPRVSPGVTEGQVGSDARNGRQACSEASVVIWCHQTFWMWLPEGMELGRGV